MDTFHNNEETYYVYEDKDIREILEDKLGRDFAEYIMSRIEEADAEAIYAENLAATDFINMEMQNERWQNVMEDTTASLKKLYDYIVDSKRLDRNKITMRIRLIVKAISGQM